MYPGILYGFRSIVALIVATHVVIQGMGSCAFAQNSEVGPLDVAYRFVSANEESQPSAIAAVPPVQIVTDEDAPIKATQDSRTSENRRSEDIIFSEPKGAVSHQIVWSAAELLLVRRVWPGLTAYQNALASAEAALNTARDTPTSEEHRSKLIYSIVTNPDNFAKADDAGDFSKLDDYQKKRIARIRAARLLTSGEQQSAVKLARTHLEYLQNETTQVAYRLGYLDRSVRVARIATSYVLIGDVVSRALVWYLVDADPTMSPVVTFVQKTLLEN